MTMPTAVVKLSPFLADQIFFGMPVPEWWIWLCQKAGLEAELVLDDTDAQGRLRVDGQYLGIDHHELADLDEHDGVLSTHPPDEIVVAAGPTSRARLGKRWSGRRRLMTTEEPIAVHDFASLHAAEQSVRWRVLEQARARGVRIVDPTRTFISPTVVVDSGATIWPDTWLLGRTIVRVGAVIHPGCHVTNSTIGAGSQLRPYCVLDGAELGTDVTVGPFAHLRPGTQLGDRARIGNFVEVKNSTFGAGSKANHLAYIGDAALGDGVNFSAGAITCNYDGARKHRTEIGDGAFIGTNASLVAPLKVGGGALIAAGSVVTADVEPGALAVERAHLRQIDGRGAQILQRNRAAAAAANAARAELSRPRDVTESAGPAITGPYRPRADATDPSLSLPGLRAALEAEIAAPTEPGPSAPANRAAEPEVDLSVLFDEDPG
jgi:bifunctional UDP-N-acetylglucosamine pyrophosphorylase/glucosamine-1-phosphate N-acetyltransferase